MESMKSCLISWNLAIKSINFHGHHSLEYNGLRNAYKHSTHKCEIYLKTEGLTWSGNQIDLIMQKLQ